MTMALVLVDFGRKTGLVNFGWKTGFWLEKLVLVNFDRKNWLLSILAKKTGCLPKKLVLVDFGWKTGFGRV